MRIYCLEIFLSVVDSGSIANAARLQNLTQPAVSRIVQSLEKELDVQLIVRRRGQRESLELTPAGKCFISYARRTVAEYNDICLNLKAITGEPLNTSLVTSPSPGSSIVPMLLNRFRDMYPQVSIKSHTLIGYPNECLTDFEDYDIGISSEKPKNELLTAEPFFYDPIILIAPAAMNLPDTLSLKDMKQLLFVVRPAGGKNMRRIASELIRHHVSLDDLNIAMTVNGDADVLQAVAGSSGVGFVTRSLYEASAQREAVKAVRINNFEIKRTLYLVKKRKRNLSVAASMLWDFARSTDWRNKYRYETIPKY